MSAVAPIGGERVDLLSRARAGDGHAFESLVASYQRPLHVHCYRLLGSYHDAEEATQETLLRAWRSLDTYEQRAPLLHWLYRIATTTCLRMLERRNRQPTSIVDVEYLQPYPDRLLRQVVDVGGDPAVTVDARESVRLAFIAALQCLPAVQRAVLILRDVLGWRAAEVAELLDTTVVAVNSASQRARAGVRAVTAREPTSYRLQPRDLEVAERFVRAWRRDDVAALAELLREDVVLRMPPERVEIRGRTDVVDFFATVPAGGQLNRFRLAVTAGNGDPVIAAYLPDQTGRFAPYGLMVLAIRKDGIAAVTGFPDPGLFALFGLPAAMPAGKVDGGGVGWRSDS